MKKPFAIIGYGGHGRVVAAALEASGEQVIAATDLAPEKFADENGPFPIMSDQQLIDRYVPADIYLALGLGSLWPSGEDCLKRRSISTFTRLGFEFIGFRHPAAWIAPDAIVASSAQIHAGVIIQPGAVIREFAIVNTRASIDHDCVLGRFCHVGPGATLSGNVEVGAGSHLGTGCVVIQGIRLGEQSFVAAGATVVRDVGDYEYVRGVPARPFVSSKSRGIGNP